MDNEQKQEGKQSFDINLNSSPATLNESHEIKMENLASNNSSVTKTVVDDQKTSSVKKYIVYGLITILILAGAFAAYLFYFKNLLGSGDSNSESTVLDENQITNTLSGPSENTSTNASENFEDPAKMDQVIDDLSKVYSEEPQKTKTEEEQTAVEEPAPTIDFSGLPGDDEVVEEEEEVVEKDQAAENQETVSEQEDPSTKVMR